MSPAGDASAGNVRPPRSPSEMSQASPLNTMAAQGFQAVKGVAHKREPKAESAARARRVSRR